MSICRLHPTRSSRGGPTAGPRRAAARGLAGALAALSLALAGAAPAEGATTLRIPLPQDPGTLTPLTFTLGYPLLTLVYDTLTWRDASGVPRPWLARSVRAADDGRRIVVRLRDDARWHDGRAVTAADVAFTYELLRERRHPRFASQLAAIADVRVRAPLTVEFVLRHPSIGFADQPLADVPILPAHRWRGLGPGLRAPAGTPVGSGPYRISDRAAGGALRLVAVRDYFRGRPRAERIEVPVIGEPRDNLAALKRGDVDMLPFSLTRAQAASVESIGVRASRGALYNGTMLMFNLRRAPFDRPAVRRAIAASLDRERIARGAGSSTPATSGPLHPRSRWAPAAAPTPAGAAAGRSLRDLGLPPLRVLAPANDPLRREAGRQVVLALRRAGARARLVALSPERLGRAVGEGGARPRFGLAVWSIPALASHDPDFLAAVFGARDAGGALNHTGYRSARFARLAGAVRAAPTVRARRAAVAELLGRLARDVPAVPLLFGDGAFAHRANAPVGWTYVAGSGILDKRSFLRAPAARASAGAAPARAGDGTGLFGVLGAGMLALALALAGAAALARRR